MNSNIIEMLSNFANLHGVIGDTYKEKAYRRAALEIKKLNFEVDSNYTGKIPGVGPTIAKKIAELLKTGRVTELVDLEKSPSVLASRIFDKILGVGPATIKKWLKLKIYTLADLRRAVANEIVTLNNTQKYGLIYYSDLNTRIPRDEVRKLSSSIHGKLIQIDPEILFEVCGSYRRQAESSGDIDILVSNPLQHRDDLLTLFADSMVDDPNFIDVISGGPERVTFLYKSPISGIVRQIDILNIRYSSFFAAVLYFTGSWEFNLSMREFAKSRGYRLNQAGLYKIKNTSRAKVDQLDLISVDSESEIFDILGLKYMSPENRFGDVVQKSN